MIFEGCRETSLGGTIILRGGSVFELARLKHVLLSIIFAYYNSKLEISYLMDSHALPPSQPRAILFDESHSSFTVLDRIDEPLDFICVKDCLSSDDNLSEKNLSKSSLCDRSSSNDDQCTNSNRSVPDNLELFSNSNTNQNHTVSKSNNTQEKDSPAIDKIDVTIGDDNSSNRCLLEECLATTKGNLLLFFSFNYNTKPVLNLHHSVLPIC